MKLFFFIDNEILRVLNSGTIKELKKLQGVGQKRAQLIADWRTVHGPFQQVNILVPIALFASLSRQGLGTRNEGLWSKGFPVLDSRTSSLYVCGRDVSINRMGDAWRLLFPLKISLLQTAYNKKNELI